MEILYFAINTFVNFLELTLKMIFLFEAENDPSCLQIQSRSSLSFGAKKSGSSVTHYRSLVGHGRTNELASVSFESQNQYC